MSNAPALGGTHLFSGMEPGLGGVRGIKPDPLILAQLLDDSTDVWNDAVANVLDTGRGRVYAAELVRMLATPYSARRREGGLTTPQRIAITRALEAFGEEISVQALIDLLDDKAWWVGQYAVDALVAVGMSALPFVVRALEDGNPIVRRRAATVLGEIGDRRAVEPLMDSLESDPVAWVRACSARALVSLRDRRSVEILRRARQDEDMTVRGFANQALAAIDPSFVG